MIRRFIENLPPFLIDAFRSTLLESISANVLLHVIDAADEQRDEKIAVVNNILNELEVKRTPCLVFNKVDKLTSNELYELQQTYTDQTAFFISALSRTGLNTLKQVIHDTLELKYEFDQQNSPLPQPFSTIGES